VFDLFEVDKIEFNFTMYEAYDSSVYSQYFKSEYTEGTIVSEVINRNNSTTKTTK